MNDDLPTKADAMLEMETFIINLFFTIKKCISNIYNYEFN